MSAQSNPEKTSNSVGAFFERYASLDKRGPWSLLGWVFGILSIAVSLYLYYVSQPRPAIRGTVVAARVLSNDKKISGIQIIRQGEDISERNQNISILTIRIENIGNTTIRKSDFDEDNEFGIAISNGTVLDDPVAVEPSTARFLEPGQLVAVLDEKAIVGTCRIRPFILEPGEYFTVSAAVLHDRAFGPRVKCIGKIAGVSEVPLELTEAHLRTMQMLFYIGVVFGSLLGTFLGAMAGLFLQDRRWKREVRNVFSKNMVINVPGLGVVIQPASESTFVKSEDGTVRVTGQATLGPSEGEIGTSHLTGDAVDTSTSPPAAESTT